MKSLVQAVLERQIGFVRQDPWRNVGTEQETDYFEPKEESAEEKKEALKKQIREATRAKYYRDRGLPVPPRARPYKVSGNSAR